MTDTQHVHTLARLRAPVAIAATAVAACTVIWVADPTTPGGFLPPCPTNWLLGIDCPGCGTLRMIYSVLHGDVLAGLRYNAVALVALVLLVWAFGVFTYGRVTGRPRWSWQHHRWAPYVALAVFTTWFVVRNIPVPPFTSLHV